MAKITINKQNKVDSPTLILRNRSLENIGKIKNYEGLSYSEKLNESNTLSFTTYKKLNGIKNEYWDDIVDFKLLFIPEIHEQFQIKVSTNEADSTTKEVTCTPLSEAELSQVNLYDVAINTEDDKLRDGNINVWDNYDVNFPTIFYRNPDRWMDYDWSDTKYSDTTVYTDEVKKKIIRNSSLLHRVLEKAVTYKIGHVQESLWNIFKEFTFDDTDIYSALTSTIAEEVGCLFIFDSVSRTVNVYDLYNTCTKCGYRGDYDEYCPECHSTEFEGQYGEDTTIFITTENLSSEITLDSDIDSAKNCFRVEGGDDNITAAVSNVNPNGTSYIYQIADWMKKDMPDELVVRLNEYENKYNEYLEKTYLINSQEMTLRYNGIVQYVEERYPSQVFEKIPLDDNSFGKIETYEKLTDYYYQSISLYSYLNDAMMPEMETVNKDIDSQLEILSAITSIAVNINVSSVQQGAVENAINSYARCLIDTSLFSIELLESNYATATHIWTGKIQLTEIADDTNVKSTDTLTITVNDNVLNFVQEKVQKTISKKKINDITNISDVKNVPLEDFKKYLHYYSYNELKKIYQCFDDCTSVIVESVAETEDEIIKKSVDDYRLEYQNRLVEINAVMELRKSQLDVVTNIQNYIVKNKLAVRSELDIQTFLGDDLYKIFFAYRREQKYANDNYISDDLTDSELIQKARELFEKAQKELDKASKITYSISATLNNLLAIPKFAPLRDYFEIGNWIRVKIDNEIYKLRLTSYDINYDDLDSISVEFSNVTKNSCTTASVQDVLNAASSISTTYNALTQQMDYTKSTNSIVKNWVYEGLDTTMTKIVNNAETQDVTMGTSGIYCRAYDDIKGDYDDCYLRIINNGMYLFTDGGKTLKTAVGKFWYNKNIVYGINAEVLVGNLLAGNQLLIGDSEGNVQITKDGIIAKNGYFDISNGNKRVIIDPKDFTKTGYIFQINNGQEPVVSIKADGNSVFNGEIQAKKFTVLPNAEVDGIKIVNETKYEYAITTTPNQPTSGWSTNYPTTINNGTYVWTRTTISYVGNKYSDSVSYSYSYVGTNGKDGNNGKDGVNGDNGNDGISVKNVIFKYGISNSSTTAPSIWYETIPTITSLTEYVWRKTIVYYSNDTSSDDGGKYDAELTNQTRPALSVETSSTGVKIHPVSNSSDYLSLTSNNMDIVVGGYTKAHFGTDGIWLGGNSTSSVSSTDYVFKVDSDGNGIFAGSLSSATGTFCGDLRVNPSISCPGCYNFNIDKDGLKIGAADGGSRYMLTIQNDGNLITYGSIKTYSKLEMYGNLQIGSKFIYEHDNEDIPNSKLSINGDILLKTSASNSSTLHFLDGNEPIGGLSFNYLSGKSSGVTLSSNGMLSLIGNSGISMDVGAGDVRIIGTLKPTDIQYPYIIDKISTLKFSSDTNVESDNQINLSSTYTLKSSTNKAMIIPVSTGRFNIMSISTTSSEKTLTISMQCRNVAPSKGSPTISCYIVEYQSKSTSTTSDEVISDEAII